MEQIMFDLPQIADGQTETLHWLIAGNEGTIILVNGLWTIYDTFTQYPGEHECYIEIWNGDTLLWHSQEFMVHVAELPDVNGGGGAANYDNLTNKPKINGVELSGNKSLSDIGAAAVSDIPTKASDLTDDSGHYTKPAGGIPDSDIASSEKWDAKYDKPNTGIPATDLAANVIPDITGKADKVSSAAEGNFAALDANGNLTDSGHKHSDYLTEHQDISGKLDAPPTTGTTGQVPRLASNGGMEWSSEGQPTDEQVGTAVSTWLNAHPEATTTVVDGSITKAKLDSNLKETVDDVDELKSAIISEKKIAYDTSLWEKGGISSSGGGDSSSNTRMRTIGYLEYGIDIVEPVTGYKYLIYAYDGSNNNSFVGVWDGTQFKKSATWLTNSVSLHGLGYRNYNYRLVAATSSDSTITLETDATKILFYFNTDKSFSASGIPADAKETGLRLSDITKEIGVSSREIRAPKGWTYYGKGYFSGGNIITANAYSIYYFIADEAFDLWTDADVDDGTKNAYARVYSSSQFSDSTLLSVGGNLLRNSSGEVTGSSMPTSENRWRVSPGQYVVISISDTASRMRLLVNGDSMAKYYISPEAVLDGAQIKQVNDAQIHPIISKTATRVDMFIPTSNKKYYINYCFTYVNKGIEGEVTDNGLGWRMSYVYLCNLDKSHVKYIAYTGEWEMAVKISGRSDFIGLGNHGDEIQTLFKLFVDGDEITENSEFGDRTFEEVQLVCKLTMYDPADHMTVVGYHTRITTINASKKTVTIENKVDFVAGYTMDSSYLFMAPLSRSHDDVQITDLFIDNQDYILTDCTTPTFNPSDANHGVGEAKNDATEYKFWGSGFDLYGYARILRRVAPEGNRGFTTISDASSYNKIYFSMCTSEDTVSAGDKWILETEFFMDSGYDPS